MIIVYCDREHTYALKLSFHFATGEDSKPSLEKWQAEPLQDLQYAQLVELDTRACVVQPGRMYVARQCATFSCSAMRPIQLADFGATEDEPAVKLQRAAAVDKAAKQRAEEKTQREGDKRARVASFIGGAQQEATKKVYDAIQTERQVILYYSDYFIAMNHWHTARRSPPKKRGRGCRRNRRRRRTKMKPLNSRVEGQSLSGVKHQRPWRLIIMSTANVARSGQRPKRDKRIKEEAIEAGAPDIKAFFFSIK
jgi:hypothetical protein